MTRFNITLEESIKLVLMAIKTNKVGKYLFPKYLHIEL